MASNEMGGGGAVNEPHPLVKALQAILTEIDSQYERERDTLGRTLPVTEVKERALKMLEDQHLQHRENYVRELAALLGGAQ